MGPGLGQGQWRAACQRAGLSGFREALCVSLSLCASVCISVCLSCRLRGLTPDIGGGTSFQLYGRVPPNIHPAPLRRPTEACHHPPSIPRPLSRAE